MLLASSEARIAKNLLAKLKRDGTRNAHQTLTYAASAASAWAAAFLPRLRLV